MKKYAILSVLFVSLLASALAQELPPGPSTVQSATFEDVQAPDDFDLVQTVLEFAPGAWTPLHTHGGEAFVTVLDGELVVRNAAGTETTYAAGDTWVERIGDFAEVGNMGDMPARIFVTFLLPKGAELTTVHE